MITYLKRKTKRKGISGIRGIINNYSYWPTYCLTSCLHFFGIQTLIDFPVYVFLLVPFIPSPIVPSLVFPFPTSPFLRSVWLTMAKVMKLKASRSPKGAHLELGFHR